MKSLVLFYRNRRLGIQMFREQVGKVIVDHGTLEWQDHDPKGDPTDKGEGGRVDSTGRPHFINYTESPEIALWSSRDGHLAYNDDGAMTGPTSPPRERATVTYDKQNVSVDRVEPGYSVFVWRLEEVRGEGIVPFDVKADEPKSDDDSGTGEGDSEYRSFSIGDGPIINA